MQRNGIGGVFIVDLKGDGGLVPEGPVHFGSPEFWDDLKFAVSEADRLGLKIRMNPGSGWSTGGPWITPELSMQHVVSSEAVTNGGGQSDLVLPLPPNKASYYRDIAVLAFPSLVGESQTGEIILPNLSSNVANEEVARLRLGKKELAVHLPLPTKQQPVWIQLEYSAAYPARSLQLSKNSSACEGEIESSDDGTNFRKIRSFSIPYAQRSASFSFDAEPARFFRVVFTNSKGWEKQFDLDLLALSSQLVIDELPGKIYEAGYAGAGNRLTLNGGNTISPDKIVDLTRQMAPDGKLTCKLPPGSWTILRLGMTTTGTLNRVARRGAEGLECDKFNSVAMDTQWNGFDDALLRKIGPLARKTFLGTFVDSYETGYANWTPGFEAEFRKRRGYDLRPFLPAMTGRFVGSLDSTERFLWDFRRTLEELFAQSYSKKIADLNHQQGLDYVLEPYAGGPFNSYTYGKWADVPMEEFWCEDLGVPGTSSMASIGHLYGRNVVAAESFTARKTSLWQADPYSLKRIGDVEFARGINHFFIHSYAHQPWPNAEPGVTFDRWGTRFERTTTWWNQGSAWLRYIARSCFLLRQGLPVSDVVGFSRYDLPQSYAWDSCDDDAILTRMTVDKGRIVLPDGMSYRVLTLPSDGTMTMELLQKVRELVKQGATVYGPKPTRLPTLEGFPRADKEFAALADEVWGSCNGQDVKQHGYGAGKVVNGRPLAEILQDAGVRPDFSQVVDHHAEALRYIHRQTKNADLYFVCNPAETPVDTRLAFRVTARPEFWHADTGEVELPAVYASKDGQTTLPIHLDPHGSMFVVFRNPPDAAKAVAAITAPDGSLVLGTTQAKLEKPKLDTNFTMDIWALPNVAISLPEETTHGIVQNGRNDAIFPIPGHEVIGFGHAGSGVSIGTNGIMVLEHSAGYLAPVLVYAGPLSGWSHVTVVYQDGNPSLYVNGNLAHQGRRGPMKVHPGSLSGNYKGDTRGFTVLPEALTAQEVAALGQILPPAYPLASELPLVLSQNGQGSLVAMSISAPAGNYIATTLDGATHPFHVDAVPGPRNVDGPWTISFPPNMGAPAELTFDKLVSWTEHEASGVRYFSGTATYRKSIELDAESLKPDRHVLINLGEVKNVARVSLNGKDLGLVWKYPFVVDITGPAHPGPNDLQIEITNLWPNRLIGDEQMPNGPEWSGAALKYIPAWVLEGKPSPTGRIAFSVFRPFTEDSPLLRSGLLGPVTLHFSRKIAVK